MKKPLIITIGREYGSGGRQIGQALAKRLGISYYDKEIITLAAQKSGLSDEFCPIWRPPLPYSRPMVIMSGFFMGSPSF